MPPSPPRTGDRAPLSNTDARLRPCWHPVARTDEVGPRPVQVRLLGEAWTLLRRSGTPDLGTTRAVRAVRERDGAAPGAVDERDGMVFLAPEPPITDLLEVDVAADPSFAVGWLRPVRARVGAGLMTDNFLDLTHVPFLHPTLIGAGAVTTSGEVTVTRDGLGMVVESEHELAVPVGPDDPGASPGPRPPVQRRRVRFVHRAPFMVSRRIDHLDAGGTHVVVLYVQPEDEQSCRLYCALYRDDLGPPGSEETRRRMAEAVRDQTRALDEDLSLQTRYRDLRLPLDLRTEVHVPADRPTVELRRILAELAATR